MNELAEIKLLFVLVCEGPAWHGSNLKEVINGVGAEQAFKKPAGVKANIAELLQHMSVWRNYALEKEAGQNDFEIELNSSDDWPVMSSGNQEDWERIKREFLGKQDSLLQLMDRHDTLWLNEIVPLKKYDYRHLLHGIIHHDLYHSGQIALLNAFTEAHLLGVDDK